MAHFWLTFWPYLRWSLEFLYEPPFVYGTLLFGLRPGRIRSSSTAIPQADLETDLRHCRSAILILPGGAYDCCLRSG